MRRHLRAGVLIGPGMVGIHVFEDGEVNVFVMEGTAYATDMLRKNADGSYAHGQLNRTISNMKSQLKAER